MGREVGGPAPPTCSRVGGALDALCHVGIPPSPEKVGNWCLGKGCTHVSIIYQTQGSTVPSGSTFINFYKHVICTGQ